MRQSERLNFFEKNRFQRRKLLDEYSPSFFFLQTFMLTRNNAVRSFRPFCGSLHVSHYSTVPTTTTAPPTSIQVPSIHTLFAALTFSYSIRHRLHLIVAGLWSLGLVVGRLFLAIQWLFLGVRDSWVGTWWINWVWEKNGWMWFTTYDRKTRNASGASLSWKSRGSSPFESDGRFGPNGSSCRFSRIYFYY